MAISRVSNQLKAERIVTQFEKIPLFDVFNAARVFVASSFESNFQTNSKNLFVVLLPHYLDPQRRLARRHGCACLPYAQRQVQPPRGAFDVGRHVAHHFTFHKSMFPFYFDDTFPTYPRAYSSSLVNTLTFRSLWGIAWVIF